MHLSMGGTPVLVDTEPQPSGRQAEGSQGTWRPASRPSSGGTTAPVKSATHSPASGCARVGAGTRHARQVVHPQRRRPPACIRAPPVSQEKVA